MLLHTSPSRRRFLHVAAGSPHSLSAGPAGLAARAEELKKQNKACILLWMAGGPSQFETFDPKPGARTQGPTKAIATAVPGIQVAEHWPRMAGVMNELAVIRSMTSKEGNHGRATYLLHTSYPPSGGIVHPGFGSLVAQQLGHGRLRPAALRQHLRPERRLRVSSASATRRSSSPTRTSRRTTCASPVNPDRLNRRLGLMKELEAPLARTGAGPLVSDHQTLYGQTARMVLSPRMKAFDLAREPDAVARPVRPIGVRPGLPDGPPAGRGGRHVRRGPVERLGHARQRTARAQEADPAGGPGDGGAAG